MRSKEVEEAIKVIKKDLDLAKKELDIETECTEPYRPRIAYLYQQKETYDTLLSYIEQLEQLPNKIRDKIKELEELDLEIYETDTEDVRIAKYEQRAMLDMAREIIGE